MIKAEEPVYVRSRLWSERKNPFMSAPVYDQSARTRLCPLPFMIRAEEPVYVRSRLWSEGKNNMELTKMLEVWSHIWIIPNSPFLMSWFIFHNTFKMAENRQKEKKKIVQSKKSEKNKTDHSAKHSNEILIKSHHIFPIFSFLSILASNYILNCIINFW